jgi:hypothetical protein
MRKNRLLTPKHYLACITLCALVVISATGHAATISDSLTQLKISPSHTFVGPAKVTVCITDAQIHPSEGFTGTANIKVPLARYKSKGHLSLPLPYLNHSTRFTNQQYNKQFSSSGTYTSKTKAARPFTCTLLPKDASSGGITIIISLEHLDLTFHSTYTVIASPAKVAPST